VLCASSLAGPLDMCTTMGTILHTRAVSLAKLTSFRLCVLLLSASTVGSEGGEVSMVWPLGWSRAS